MVKTGLSTVKSVTSINTICDLINKNDICKKMFSSIHLLLHLNLAISITSSTVERRFSDLRRLYIYA